MRSLKAGFYQRLGGRSVPRTHVEMAYYRNLTKRCRYRKFRVPLHQVLQGFRHPINGMGWQCLKSVRQLLVGNEDLALLTSAATVTRLASCLLHLGIMGIRNPNEQFSLHLIQDAQPVRFLWHVQRVEKQLRFNPCSVEILGDYRNPI